MLYNQPLNYQSLSSVSDDLKNYLPIAKDISIVAHGGSELDPTDYLLIRDDESPKITKKRVEKFAPENYLGAAIRLQRVLQKSGVLEIKSESLPGDLTRWETFFNRVDKRNSSLKDFVIDVFTEALVNKFCYIQIELNKLDHVSVTEAEAETILNNRQPYYFKIPLQSIMVEKCDGDSIEWIKYRRLDKIDDPFGKTIYNMSYVLIDNEHITTWTYYDVIVNDSGGISKIWDQSLNFGKGNYRYINKEKDKAEPQSIPHNRGACPVVRYRMDDYLYMADQVYLAQKMIYGLSMNLFHTAANAGFIQKWIRPYIAGNDTKISKESGGASYIPLPKEALNEIVKKYAESLGDESVIMADFFTFEELAGTSVEMQIGLIERLRNYIFMSILFNNSKFEKTNNDNQSGAAKEIDFYVQNLALKDHGSGIVEFTRSLLNHTAKAFGYDSGDIIVSGMDRYDVRPLEGVLTIIERLFKLPQKAIPKDLLIESMSQLTRLIIENTTFEYKNTLNDAIIDSIDNYLESLDNQSLADENQL
ncbi:portal protein [Anabaena phage Elbi]|nr:portal protein [Anabaena phage Elbi]